MKSRIAVCVLSFSVLVLSLLLDGCADGIGQSSEDILSEVSDHVLNYSGDNSERSESDPESDMTELVIPKGKPTIFVGLDGNVIYSGDVTKMYDIYVDDTITTPDKITKDTENAKIICDGFGYFREPNGSAFDNYHSPELFSGYEFLGEIPKNNNECKRVDVGDKFCGLTLTKALVGFEVYNGEPVFQKSITAIEGSYAEFDGTVTLEGLLLVSPRSSYEPDGGQLRFYPTENKLPIINSKTDDETFFSSSVWGSDDYYIFNEMGEMYLDSSEISYKDIDGMGIGDVALVRVTLDKIKYYHINTSARLKEIEVLSDVIEHINDGF